MLALPQAPREDAQSRYSRSVATPRPPQRRDDGAARAGRGPAARGDAPWALSALPECFRQRRITSGGEAFVRAKMPPAARRVAGGMELATVDCRLFVGAAGATVRRGDDAFRIPPPARFSVAGDRLLLETRDGARVTLRTYVLVAGGAPRFEGPAKPYSR